MKHPYVYNRYSPFCHCWCITLWCSGFVGVVCCYVVIIIIIIIIIIITTPHLHEASSWSARSVAVQRRKLLTGSRPKGSQDSVEKSCGLGLPTSKVEIFLSSNYHFSGGYVKLRGCIFYLKYLMLLLNVETKGACWIKFHIIQVKSSKVFWRYFLLTENSYTILSTGSSPVFSKIHCQLPAASQANCQHKPVVSFIAGITAPPGPLGCLLLMMMMMMMMNIQIFVNSNSVGQKQQITTCVFFFSNFDSWLQWYGWDEAPHGPCWRHHFWWQGHRTGCVTWVRWRSYLGFFTKESDLKSISFGGNGFVFSLLPLKVWDPR